MGTMRALERRRGKPGGRIDLGAASITLALGPPTGCLGS